MTGFRNMLQGAAGVAAGGGYSVDNSILFNDDDSPSLSRSGMSAGSSSTTFTYSTWFKRSNLTIDVVLFGANNTTSSDLGYFRFENADKLMVYAEPTDATTPLNWEMTTQQLRDPHAWYNLVVAIDTSQATASDRCTIYLNGENITANFTQTSTMGQNKVIPFTDPDIFEIGGHPANANNEFDGYLAECVFIDGQALDATSFGEYDTSGVWRPIELDTATLFPNPTITDNSVNFDGSNDYLTRGGALTGLSDGDAGSTSFWFKLNGGNGSDVSIFTDNAGHVHIRRGSDNKIRMLMHTSGAAELVDIQTSGTYIADGNWHHCMASWNTTSDTQHLYIDGVDQLSVNNSTTGTIDYTQTDYAIGARTSGTNKINSDLAEFWFTDEYLDLSQSSNRLKFLTATGAPASLGSDGSTPTGTAAVVYLSGATSTWHTNDGTGGGFTENGALTDGSTIQGVYGRNSFYLPFSAGSGANLGANSVSASTFTPAAANYTYNATYLTIGSGTINNNGSPGVSGRLNNPFNGDFTFSFTATAIAGSIFGVFDATELSSFSTGTDDGGLDSMTNSWWYDDGGNGTGGGGTVGNGYFMYGNSSQGTGPIAAGSAVTIERTGSTIKITDDSSDAHSFSQTFSGPVYIMIGHRNITSKSMDYDSVSMNGIQAFAVSGSPTQSSDTPTTVYPVFTPLHPSIGTLSEGNTKAVPSNSAGSNFCPATFGTGTTGKYYVEFTMVTDNGYGVCGFLPVSESDNAVTPGQANHSTIALGGLDWEDSTGGFYRLNHTTPVYSGSTYTTGDILGFYLDFDNDAIWASKNGTLENGASQAEVEAGTTTNAIVTGTLATDGALLPYVGCTGGTSMTWSINCGQQTFNTALYTGYSELSSASLYTNAAPAVADGSDVFVMVDDTETNIVATLAAAHSYSTYLNIFKNIDSTESWYWQFSTDSANCFNTDTTDARETFPTLSGSDNFLGIAINAGANGVVIGSASHTNGGGDTTVTHNSGVARHLIFVFPQAGGTRPWFHPDFDSGKLCFTETSALPTTSSKIKNIGTNSFDIDTGEATDTYWYVIIPEIEGVIDLGKLTSNGSTNGPLVLTTGSPILTWEKRTLANDAVYWQGRNIDYSDEANPFTRGVQLGSAAVSGSANDTDHGSNFFKGRNSGQWNSGTNAMVYVSFNKNASYGKTPATAR